MQVLEIMMRGFAGVIPFIVISLVLLGGFQWLYDRFTPFDDRKELANGNVAVGINRAGAYVGISLAVAGSLILSEDSYGMQLWLFAVNGVIAIAVFSIAYPVFDWVILRKVNNARAIRDGNVAAAWLEAFVYVALGIIVCASFSGNGQSFWPGIGSALLFSLIGLGTLMAVYWTYAFFSRCDIDREVANGNVAAAIDAGSLLLAMSIALFFSISGDFTGWMNDILAYVIAAASSLTTVGVARLVVSKAVVRSSNPIIGKHHGGIVRSLMVAGVSVGIGVLAGVVTFF